MGSNMTQITHSRRQGKRSSPGYHHRSGSAHFSREATTSTQSLRDWMVPVIGIALIWFLVTALFLHAFLDDRGSPVASLARANQDPENWETGYAVWRERRSQPTRELLLKARYEERYPPNDTERTRRYVSAMRDSDDLPSHASLPYDIHNCPVTPPDGYPFSWNVVEVLNHWNPNQTTLPDDFVHQALCIFDYERDFDKALAYRLDEVPFVVQNTPVLWETAERWNRHESYLLDLLGDQPFKAEHAHNPHFMYWKVRRGMKPPPDWREPTEITKLSYPAWLANAKKYETSTKSPAHVPEELWYFRLNGALHQKQSFLYDELPLFNPLQRDRDGAFFIVEPDDERGINCRFGMKGIIAEAHFDGSRNFIAVLGGQRRYILAHPDQCENMELYDVDHPSGRHSSVDWTKEVDPDRPFAQAQVHEVVLQAGDALYLPTHYFHFIVNLNRNFQCNARSGVTDDYKEYIEECGFT